MAERGDLVIIDGIQYQRAYAEARGLAVPEAKSESGTPSRSTARTSGSARTPGGKGGHPPVVGGKAATEAAKGAKGGKAAATPSGDDLSAHVEGTAGGDVAPAPTADSETTPAPAGEGDGK